MSKVFPYCTYFEISKDGEVVKYITRKFLKRKEAILEFCNSKGIPISHPDEIIKFSTASPEDLKPDVIKLH
jgi:hypothetical protein